MPRFRPGLSTVLLRSDGQAAFGASDIGQCEVSGLEPGLVYVANGAVLVVLLLVGRLADNYTATIRDIATGEALARWIVAKDCGACLIHSAASSYCVVVFCCVFAGRFRGSPGFGFLSSGRFRRAGADSRQQGGRHESLQIRQLRSARRARRSNKQRRGRPDFPAIARNFGQPQRCPALMARM